MDSASGISLSVVHPIGLSRAIEDKDNYLFFCVCVHGSGLVMFLSAFMCVFAFGCISSMRMQHAGLQQDCIVAGINVLPPALVNVSFLIVQIYFTI